jgi:hypothetical protein
MSLCASQKIIKKLFQVMQEYPFDVLKEYRIIHLLSIAYLLKRKF